MYRKKISSTNFFIVTSLVLIVGAEHTVKAITGFCKTDEVCKSIIKCAEYEYVLSRNYDQLRNMKICGTGIGTDEHCCKKVPDPAITTPATIVNTSTQQSVRLGNIPQINHRMCGRSLSWRIVGGTKTAVKQYPWMALLRYQDNEQKALTFRCGGSLITAKHVLTAAHCLKDVNSKLVMVRLGEHTLSTAIDCDNSEDPKTCFTSEPVIQDIEPEDLIVHKQYDSFNKVNDIGLIRLMSAVVFSDVGNVETICLPTHPDHQIENLIDPDSNSLTFTIAGWGFTEYEHMISDVLLQATVDYVDSKNCSSKYAVLAKTHSWINTEIKDSQVCAGGKDKTDTCHGDSGGPLMVQAKLEAGKFRTFQAGIVSAGIRGCSTITPHPGLYTRVANFIPWILENL